MPHGQGSWRMHGLIPIPMCSKVKSLSRAGENRKRGHGEFCLHRDEPAMENRRGVSGRKNRRGKFPVAEDSVGGGILTGSLA